jgi:hypothetical protein
MAIRQLQNLLLSQFCNFSSEHCFWCSCTVDAVGFDRDNYSAADFQEVVSIQTNDTGWKRELVRPSE